MTIRYAEVAPEKGHPESWLVYSVDEEGRIFSAIFEGPDAKTRAEAHATTVYENWDYGKDWNAGPKYEAFMRDLSDVCRKHGLAILDGGVVYEMHHEDTVYDYFLRADGTLRLATPLGDGNRQVKE